MCELLTPRFRFCFEDAPHQFLATFDAEHSSGSTERGNRREWSAERREQLAALVAREARALLEAARAEEPDALPPLHSGAEGGGRRGAHRPPPPPSEAWLEAAARVEATWRAAAER